MQPEPRQHPAEIAQELPVTMSHATSVGELSEEALAANAQRGCEASFAELDRRLRPRLLHVLVHRMGNRTDAEDLVQQTLLRVFEKIHLYDPRQRVSPWVFTIALRLAASHRRRKTLETAQQSEQLSQVVESQPQPEHQAMIAEERDQLWALAARVLKSEQWTALWLFYGEEQSLAEVARSLGRTRASASVLLYRARKGLLPHLERTAQDTVAAASAVGRPPQKPPSHHPQLAGSKR